MVLDEEVLRRDNDAFKPIKMCFEYKRFGIGKIGYSKIRNISHFNWMPLLPMLWYFKGNMNKYLSGNLRFTALGVLCESKSLAGNNSPFELGTLLI